MKKQKNLKTILLTLMLLVVVAPMAAFAQSDGFFRGNNDNYQNRDGETSFTVNTQDFGQEVPLGSGIVILLAAGTGYVALRKNGRKTMKKMAVFAAAFVLTLGLSQCKKDQHIAQTPEGEVVHITVKTGNSGSKAGIDLSNGHITFNNGDKLYVGYNGKKVGELTYASSTSSFSGDLTITDDPNIEPLHFYYLGGSLTPSISGSRYSVNIQWQHHAEQSWPVISCGTSTNNYTGAGNYTTTLENKCGLVKFSTNLGFRQGILVYGMNTVATVDFATGEITSGTPDFVSLLTRGYDGDVYAILLPQSAVYGANVTQYGSIIGTFDVPEITDNYTNINTTGIEITEVETPEGLNALDIDGTYTVYYADGDTWAEALNRPENAGCELEIIEGNHVGFTIIIDEEWDGDELIYVEEERYWLRFLNMDIEDFSDVYGDHTINSDYDYTLELVW